LHQDRRRITTWMYFTRRVRFNDERESRVNGDEDEGDNDKDDEDEERAKGEKAKSQENVHCKIEWGWG